MSPQLKIKGVTPVCKRCLEAWQIGEPTVYIDMCFPAVVGECGTAEAWHMYTIDCATSAYFWIAPLCGKYLSRCIVSRQLISHIFDAAGQEAVKQALREFDVLRILEDL